MPQRAEAEKKKTLYILNKIKKKKINQSKNINNLMYSNVPFVLG